MQARLESLELWERRAEPQIQNQERRLVTLESTAPEPPPAAPEPGWNPYWLDSLKGTGPPEEKHGLYLHQGLQATENALTLTSEGLEVLYKSRPINTSEGPRCETGLWSAAHPTNRIFQREPMDGKLRRYRLEVKFPADWNPKGVGDRCVVWQFHGNNQLNPNLSFDAFYGKLRVYYRSETVAHHRAEKQLDPLPLDRWIKLEVQAVWSLTDGVLKVLVDDELWLEREGETCYANKGPVPGPDGPYVRAGIYAPGDRQAPMTGATRRVLLRNFSIEERS
jgi:hypothetical protein